MFSLFLEGRGCCWFGLGYFSIIGVCVCGISVYICVCSWGCVCVREICFECVFVFWI